MMKSILESGQEEVPAHIWEGVAGGLDRIARRKKVIIFWRRAGIAAAVAAAVVLGVFLFPENETDLVPTSAGSDMIAVAEEPIQDIQDTQNTPEPETSLIAEAGTEQTKGFSEIPSTADEAIAIADEAIATEGNTPYVKEEMTPKEEVQAEKDDAPVRFPDNWDEEEDTPRETGKTSIIMSGLAGTNSSSEKVRLGPSRKPSQTVAPIKTGVTENNSRNTYGLPVSFGAGVKIGLAPKWSISAGLNYTLLTRKFYGTYSHVNEAGVEDNTVSSDIRNSQHYIGIPVNAYYDIIDEKYMNFYAYAGGTVEKCVSDIYQVLNTPIVHKEKAPGVQLSANVGVGVEFLLGQYLGLYIDPSLRYYFNCNQPKSIRTTQPLMLGFEMGLRIRL